MWMPVIWSACSLAMLVSRAKSVLLACAILAIDGRMIIGLRRRQLMWLCQVLLALDIVRAESPRAEGAGPSRCQGSELEPRYLKTTLEDAFKGQQNSCCEIVLPVSSKHNRYSQWLNQFHLKLRLRSIGLFSIDCRCASSSNGNAGWSSLARSG